MIDILNWFAASSTRVITGLLAIWIIGEAVAIPIKAWRQK